MAHQKSADPNVFILPDLGEGVHEAELIKWRVAVGQAVSEHDILAEMETDKALVEVPSPRTGVIKQLHGTEGEILHVGNPLVSYEGAGSASVAPVGSAPGGAALQSGASSRPEPSSNGSAQAEVAERAEDAGTVVGQMSASAAGVSAAPGKALATPAVRRLARDLGLDIDTLTGTGIGGRVLEKDVRAAAGAKPTSAPRAATAPVRSEPAPSLALGARADAAPRAA
ncbi:MAG: E3 binding domain-containing protein, partial [Phycisphaerae bacterium]|nr:E3 binding domain-containing protein [Phycisphaerae bacterium]